MVIPKIRLLIIIWSNILIIGCGNFSGNESEIESSCHRCCRPICRLDPPPWALPFFFDPLLQRARFVFFWNSSYLKTRQLACKASIDMQ